jgi:uncharacterized membrane protein
MTDRLHRGYVRDPIWLALTAAFVVGLLFGRSAAHELGRDAATAVLGTAWRADPSETRAVLGGLLGFEITVVALVLSVNANVIKSAAYQYSTRLIPLYVRNAPSRRSAPVFVLLAAYLLGATRELGLVVDDGERPRSVVSIAVMFLVVALVLLGVDMFRTFRFVRIERILVLVRDETFNSAMRVRDRLKHFSVDGAARLAMPTDASALVAGESGYVVDVDLHGLTQMVRASRLRLRVSRGIGDYVDEGDVVGWVASDGPGAVPGKSMEKLVRALKIRPIRDLAYDPAFGVRIIVDVANRALSSSYNDPYTARQALNQLRSVLRYLGALPLHDWNLVDETGAIRVSVKATRLRELLTTSVVGPLHYGEDQSEILEALLEIVLAAGWVARDDDDRAAARSLLERVEGLAENSDLEPERLARLRADGAPVRLALEMNQSQNAST